MEREKIREKEPTQRDDAKHYEETLQICAALREHAKAGKIVLRAKDIPWHQNRQALVKTFLSSHGIVDSAATQARTASRPEWK